MKQAPKIYKRVEDLKGNAIVIFESGTVKLYLSGLKRLRLLGRIDFKTRIFHCKREREVHLFRKLNAYGFNNHLLERGGRLFDNIQLEDDYGRYLFSRQEVLDRKLYLNFTKQNFELQIFFPIEVMKLKQQPLTIN